MKTKEVFQQYTEKLAKIDKQARGEREEARIVLREQLKIISNKCHMSQQGTPALAH